jgi:hypothetical protein
MRQRAISSAADWADTAWAAGAWVAPVWVAPALEAGAQLSAEAVAVSPPVEAEAAVMRPSVGTVAVVAHAEPPASVAAAGLVATVSSRRTAATLAFLAPAPPVKLSGSGRRVVYRAPSARAFHSADWAGLSLAS